MNDLLNLIKQINPNVTWVKSNNSCYNGAVYTSDEGFQASEHIVIINKDEQEVKYYYKGVKKTISKSLQKQILQMNNLKD